MSDRARVGPEPSIGAPMSGTLSSRCRGTVTSLSPLAWRSQPIDALDFIKPGAIRLRQPRLMRLGNVTVRKNRWLLTPHPGDRARTNGG